MREGRKRGAFLVHKVMPLCVPMYITPRFTSSTTWQSSGTVSISIIVYFPPPPQRAPASATAKRQVRLGLFISSQFLLQFLQFFLLVNITINFLLDRTILLSCTGCLTYTTFLFLRIPLVPTRTAPLVSRISCTSLLGNGTKLSFSTTMAIRWATCVSLLLLAVAVVGNASTLTPPVLPLTVRNPYLSTWLGSARGPPWERWPIFWTGQEVSVSLLLL